MTLLEEGLGLSGISLNDVVCKSLDQYLTEMLRWNRSINLTSITAPDEATEKHLIDSLLLLPFLKGSKSLFDMGSGAGLPGIPLQIALPEVDIVSVDSVGKKVNFQRHIKRLLKLSQFKPVHSRLEELTGKLGEGTQFDVVTARAFSSMETIVRLGAPWLSGMGKILAMKGPEGESEALNAKKIIAEAGLKIDLIHKYSLPFSGAERQVIVMSKEKI